MATPGPPQARNAIKKSLFGLLGTKLTDEARDAIWEVFESSCAYCGRNLDRSRREGHMDHVVAAMAGGIEGLQNFVLACGVCNGDEKREMPWETFLATRAADPVVRREREARIRSWIASQAARAPAGERPAIGLSRKCAPSSTPTILRWSGSRRCGVTSNITFDQSAGSRSLAAAGQRGR